uniref:AMP-binding protein n=1 Tax=Yoonia rhodophyticola TaxID=3137370 RepID=A0AAN0M9C0_9RHOB
MTVLMNVHLAGGGAVVTLPRFDLPLFLQISQDHKSRRMWIVPPVALALAKHPIVDDYDLSALEQVFSGAAPLGAELSNAVEARLGCTSLQGYGMTELAPVSHVTPGAANKPGGSGQAVPNTHCRIVDIETGADLPAGQEGELWIKGPQVMQGYLNNPSATAATIVDDGWLRTGDIARIDADGYMFIVDRLKELIKYKGFQVAPAELEATLVGMDGITDAAVIGLPDPEAGELPIGFVVAAEGGRTKPRSWRISTKRWPPTSSCIKYGLWTKSRNLHPARSCAGSCATRLPPNNVARLYRGQLPRVSACRRSRRPDHPT